MVSITYKPNSVFDGYLSRSVVAYKLKRYWRDGGQPMPLASCTEWGLHSPKCRHLGGGLLPRLSTLTAF